MITSEKEGNKNYAKARSPQPFGKYSEIKTPDYAFHFNLRGQIKSIRGLNASWPHPYAFLKRTDGNDWVFYSVGSTSGISRIIDWLGEYYLPCFPYPSNSLWEFNPYTDSNLMQAFGAWSQLYASLYELQRGDAPSGIKDFLSTIVDNNENVLHTHAEMLREITGGRISVLPPDTRHVDYEVIPLIIADGCRYHCKFCCVKSPQHFKPRSNDHILQQIQRLKTFYGRDLGNYKALFLGNHDALGAGDKLIMSATEAVAAFGFEDKRSKKPILFIFGSVDSMLEADNKLFEELNHLPFYTYINVGFESVDGPTLESLRKPLDTSKIRNAFQKMLEVNQNFDSIEITGNFLLGEQLSPDHNQSLTELLESVPDSLAKKGAIYLSPFMDRQKGRPVVDNQRQDDLLQLFFKLKSSSPIPTYIYLIQRL